MFNVSPTGLEGHSDPSGRAELRGVPSRACAGSWPTSGEPLPVRNLLFDAANGLVRQSYSPRMMNTFLNLAGFGMQAWDPDLRSGPEDPFTYRATTLPSFDRNLRFLSAKVAAACLVAHVRGVTYSDEAIVADTNLHPFRFVGARVVLAHNGHLRQFPRMRYSLVEHVRPELARHIEGTTDSEWIYALVLPQLDDPYGLPETRELADATAGALRILRKVHAAHGIEYLLARQPVSRHRPRRRRDAVLVRLRLVSARGRDARNGPPFP